MGLRRYALAVAFAAAAATSAAAEEKIPAALRDALRAALEAGEPQEVLVTYEASAARAQAKQQRLARRLPEHDDEILRTKARGYAQTKAAVAAALAAPPRVVRPYAQLPVEFVQLESAASLDALLADPRVSGVALPEIHRRTLLESLPLIQQPGAGLQGDLGAGTAVAVLDTGVDYTRAAFGSCAAPGPGCRVVHAQDFAPEDGQPDDHGHGTNVAAIVLGVAPQAGVIALDVFRADGLAYSQDVIAAINWAIEQKSRYNIVAINLSLGGGRFTSPISSRSNPYKRAIDDARDAGIVVIVASGNEAYTNALASPAAVDTAVSVGAVYDSTMGAMSWDKCSDAWTAADRVTCFSNSASFLTALAPGALATAGGEQMGGTSQAAPHLSGAVAVLRSVYGADSVNQIVSRLAAGAAVIDHRNQVTKPRLDVVRSLGLDLVPDAFQFADLFDAPPGVPMTSAPVTVTGLVGRAQISISGPGEYAVNGGAFVSDSRTVAPGDAVSVRVVSSQVPGEVVSATLTVGGLSDTFSVTTSASSTAPAIAFAPAGLAFGNVNLGDTALQAVVLANAGTARLEGVTITIAGGEDFLLRSSTCGASLEAGQSCSITIAFAPSAALVRSATLRVASNASGSPHELPLSGAGIVPIALASALDAEALAFSSGGAAAWFGQGAISVAGPSAARSGAIGDLQSSFIETALVGPGTLSFQWKVSSEPTYDRLAFSLDGVELATISGEVDWTARSWSLGPGTHAVRWTYSKDSTVSSGADAAWLDAVAYAPGAPALVLSAAAVDFGDVAVGDAGVRTIVVTNSGDGALQVSSLAVTGAAFSKAEDACSGATLQPLASCTAALAFRPLTLGHASGSVAVASNAPGSPHVATLAGAGLPSASLSVALDNASLSFSTQGPAAWFGQTALTRIPGEATAQSGPAGELQASTMATTVTGPGRLTFYWKVSSAPVYDRLALLLDGKPQGWISGETDWEFRSYDIGSGTHVVAWSYVKTAEEAGGADAGWVDQVAFEPLSGPANLAEALEAASQAWRSSGIEGSAAPWVGQGLVAATDGDAAQAGAIADGQASELRTTVQGPGSLGFKWKVSSEEGFDFLCLYRDFTDSPAECISGETDWSARTVAIPPGVWPVKWIYSKDATLSGGADRAWVDEVTYVPGGVALPEALDAATAAVETNPVAPWHGQTAHAISGGDAAQTPPLEDGQRTWLQMTVTGPGTLAFQWKVSSEASYDFLRFYVDGAETPEVPAISGEVDWQQRSIALGAGTHVLAWAYWKDFYCCAEGLDAAWVDAVSFTPAGGAPVEADTSPPSAPGELRALALSSSQISLGWSAASDDVGVALYKVYRDGQLIATLPAPALGYTDAGLAGSTPYAYAVQACDAAGNCSAPSASAAATTLAVVMTIVPQAAQGWNLLGNSVNAPLSVARAFGNPQDPVTGVTSKVFSVWKWNAVSQRWAFHSPFLDPAANASYAASQGFELLESIAPGEGYWVYALEPLALPEHSGTRVAINPFGFAALPSGWNLLAIAPSSPLSPSQFNYQMSMTPPAPGSEVPSSFVSLWQWDALRSKWWFHSPLVEAVQGLSGVKAHAEANGYLDFETLYPPFTTAPKRLGPGEGFWVNKP